MISTTFLVSLVICIAFVSAGPTGGQGKYFYKKTVGRALTCQGISLKYTAEIQNKSKSCYNFKRKMAAGEENTTDISPIDITCPKLCQHQAYGVFDVSGKISADGVSTFVKSAYPESVVSEIVKSFTTCASEKGASAAIKEVAGKKDCSSFIDMFKCITESINKICQVE